MRIAAISNSRIPSTTANSIQAMKACEALVATGHDVNLLIPAETPDVAWDALARQYGVNQPFPIQRLPSLRVLRRLDFVWYAASAARTLSADLIYTWLPQSAALASWRRMPVVLEMHADVAGAFGAWWLRRFWAGSGKKRLLVTTVALREALENSTRIQFPSPCVQVAPNGVDLERYRDLPQPTEARRRLGLADAVTVGFTGHFYAGRGVDLLFKLAQSMPNVQFLWVGGTPEAVELWRRKLDAAHQTNVTLTGFVENSRVPLYQAASDILVMPYGREVAASSGQDIAGVINPMKMFEYMAAGRAIISSDLPAIREVLDDSSAVFCPVGDAAAWRAAILALVEDSGRRTELALNARRAVRQRTWHKRAQAAVQGMGSD